MKKKLKFIKQSRKLTVLAGLKRFMLANKISLIDLDWNMFKKHNIDLLKLLKWELKQKRLTPG